MRPWTNALRAALIGACVAFATLGSFVARAGEAQPASSEPAIEARMMRLASELRCLVCQNQTLADSNASLAFDLREQMRTMLRDGADEEQVRRYMTDRYGDFVLYRPPLKATTFALWLGPGALLAGGLAVLFVVLRRRQRLSAEHFDPDEDTDETADDREHDELAAPARLQTTEQGVPT